MTSKYEIVSEWRKGLAIGRHKSWSSASNSYEYVYILLDENLQRLKLVSLDHKGCIHRSIDGRYFATEMALYNAITYPGQDRDTTYLTIPIISYVLDEDGHYIISAYDKGAGEVNNYIKENPVEYTIELGEGLVLYADKTYDISSNTLHDFSPLQYILKLQEKEYPRYDEYEHELTNYNFLRYNSIKNTRENEDGEILCGSLVYGVNKCDLLFTLPKQIEPLEKYKNGVCKVGIVSDYRDFIVITSNAKIVKVYESKKMGLLNDFLNAVIDSSQHRDTEHIELLIKLLLSSYKEEETVSKCVFALPQGTKVYQVKNIEAEVVIEKYLLRFPPEYGYGVGYIRHVEKYGTKKLFVYHNGTRYYEENGLWYEITGENGNRIDEQVYEMELNRPNYIKNIKVIKENVFYKDRLFSIFKFECRPYGYITKDGSFNYNFDVDNIEW